MKLRNKKTGEVYNVINESIKLSVGDRSAQHTGYYTSLEELNTEWEDYEESKDYYCIDWTEPSGIYKTRCEDERDEFNKEIGNYFETKEEAEKAVEKLKAAKRLKDKGFRFNGWNGTLVGSNICYISEVYYEGWVDDMDLLFGGEE